ncbi:MAG TPA: hypothetical protein VK484_07200, partial [Ferruginibacter sp.]|nr:hypothetical protein [Ferruginibacter sp.]
MKKNILVIFLFLSATCFSQLNIVPMPAKASIDYNSKKFRITRSTLIVYNSDLLRSDVSYF